MPLRNPSYFKLYHYRAIAKLDFGAPAAAPDEVLRLGWAPERRTRCLHTPVSPVLFLLRRSALTADHQSVYLCSRSQLSIANIIVSGRMARNPLRVLSHCLSWRLELLSRFDRESPGAWGIRGPTAR